MGFFPTLRFHRIYSNKLGLYINFLLYMSMTTNTCSNSCFFIHLGFHMHWFSIPLYFLFLCFEILQIKDPATVMNLYCCISKEVVFFLLQTSFFVCIFFLQYDMFAYHWLYGKSLSTLKYTTFCDWKPNCFTPMKVRITQ
jgi:hypothetical protein